MPQLLHHVAVLVRSLSSTTRTLPAELERLDVQVFPAEGTKEQYIDLSSSGSPCLLLIESIGEGPYRRALQKRGTGLHHFGLRTNNLEESVGYFSAKGLLLHPISLRTLAQKTIWMCRPGIPFLVEVSEVDGLEDEQATPISIELPRLNTGHLDWIPGASLTSARGSEIGISCAGISFNIAP